MKITLITTKEAIAMLGIGVTNFYWIRKHDKTFPAPLIFGRRTFRWRRHEISAWMRTKREPTAA